MLLELYGEAHSLESDVIEDWFSMYATASRARDFFVGHSQPLNASALAEDCGCSRCCQQLSANPRARQRAPARMSGSLLEFIMPRPPRRSEYFGQDLPLMLRRDEVAGRFDDTTRTVARWTASGLLRGRKLEPGSRGTLRYLLDDVEAFGRGIGN